MVTKKEKRGNYFGKGKLDKKNVHFSFSQKSLGIFSTFSKVEKVEQNEKPCLDPPFQRWNMKILVLYFFISNI
jgi:hypothetical protein